MDESGAVRLEDPEEEQSLRDDIGRAELVLDERMVIGKVIEG